MDDSDGTMTGAEILKNIFDKTPELKKTESEQTSEASTEASMEAQAEEKQEEPSPKETEAAYKNL